MGCDDGVFQLQDLVECYSGYANVNGHVSDEGHVSYDDRAGDYDGCYLVDLNDCAGFLGVLTYWLVV